MYFRDVESGMQAIWDRGSLVAINQEDRAKYAHIFSVILSQFKRRRLYIIYVNEKFFSRLSHKDISGL